MMRSTYESPVVEHGARRVIISIAVITATLLEIIDVTIVNVSLPNIQGNFGIGVVISGASGSLYHPIANVVVIPLNPWFAALLWAAAILFRLDRHLYDCAVR